MASSYRAWLVQTGSVMPRHKPGETAPPDKLSKKDKLRVWNWARHHKNRKVRLLCVPDREGYQELASHVDNDRWHKDWARTAMNWILEHFRREAERARKRREREYPQYGLDERGSGPDNVVSIHDALKGSRWRR